MKQLTQDQIENKTGLLLNLIAEIVFGEAASISEKVVYENKERDAAKLVERFMAVINANEFFRKKVFGKGNLGRDWTYCFMRHWMASLMIGDYEVDRNTLKFKDFANGLFAR